MPTRKQRRKREKDLRHDWEEVFVDDEGRELEADEVQKLAPELAVKNGATPKTKSKPKAPQPARTSRGGRTVQPPSWRRVFKRAAIFAPLMYVFITLLDRSVSPLAALVFTIQLILLFLPFSYLMDKLTYRMWQKRQARPS